MYNQNDYNNFLEDICFITAKEPIKTDSQKAQESENLDFLNKFQTIFPEAEELKEKEC